VIPRIIRGGDIDGLVRYLYGPGRANEHSGARLIDGWRPAETIEPHITQRGNRDLRPLIQKLYAPNELMRTPQREYVWHVPISAGRAVQSRDGHVAVEADRPLTDDEFKELARDILHRTGVAPRGDEQACRWILVRHDEGQDGRQHAHLVATLARQDGGRCDAGNDWIKANDAVMEFQQRHPDLRKIRKARSSADKIPAREKVEKAARFRQRVSAMESLQREAYAARAMASNPAEYLRSLASARGQPLATAGEGSGPQLIDVKVRLPGQPELVGITGLDNAQLQTATGYALHRVGDIGTAGKPIYYRGGALGQDLSLGQLREHWRPKVAANETAPKIAARVLLRRAAVAAAESSRSWDQYTERLREQGIVVKERYSTQDPNQVTGYSVGLSGHCDPDTGRGMVAGSALKDGGALSYQRLQSRWQEPVRVGQFDAAGFDPGERAALLEEAGRVCRLMADRITQLRTSDPDSAGDAAASAADVLNAVARLIEGQEGGPVTEAAAAFGSAARELNRAPINPGPGGRALRLVAKSAYFLRSIGDDEAADRARLVVSICMLIRAAGDIRLAQGRSLDAAAAVRSTQKLDLAVGIPPTSEDWWRNVTRDHILGKEPRRSDPQSSPPGPTTRRTLQ
jgi:hypothetical protein